MITHLDQAKPSHNNAVAASAPLDKNCAEPICASKMDMFKNLTSKVQQQQQRDRPQQDQPPPTPPRGVDDGCPADREELGRRTWTLLHTIAAYYPELPSESERTHALRLIEALAVLYPCTHCAEDFRETIRESPPRVESREALTAWLCEQHNLVNAKLGKPSVTCDHESLSRRWRTGPKELNCWGAVQNPDGEQNNAETSLGQTP
jgi:FAD-linked sulfhydryl oxidase